MAYPINQGDVIQVTFAAELFQQRTMSLFHYQYYGPPLADNVAAIQDLNADLQGPAGLYTRYMAVATQDLVGAEIWIQKVSQFRYRKEVFLPTTTTGQNPADTFPPATAVAITKTGIGAGRRFVGTLHMPAIPTDAQADGVLNAGAITAYGLIGSAMTAIITFTGSSQFRPVIFNRASPADSNIVTGYVVQDTVRTMRRRVVRRGI